MFKGVIFAFIVFFSFAAQAQVVEPQGIYSSHIGRGIHKYIQEDHVKGALVRVRWSDIEKQEGVYDFSAIEKQRMPVVNAGKNWSLAVIAGANVPQWMYAKTNERMDINFRQDVLSIIPFWDDAYKKAVERLASALAQQYKADKNLVLVYIPQQTSNGIEGHFNGNSSFSLRSQGLTEGKWVEAVQHSMGVFVKAFPHTALAIELHEMLDSAEIPSRIMNYAYRHYGRHVGVGVWWLSGKEKYQSKLLDVLKDKLLPVYAQVIGRSSQKRRFYNYDYSTVFEQAEEIGARYVEVWNYEFEKPVEEGVKKSIESFAHKYN